MQQILVNTCQGLASSPDSLPLLQPGRAATASNNQAHLTVKPSARPADPQPPPCCFFIAQVSGLLGLSLLQLTRPAESSPVFPQAMYTATTAPFDGSAVLHILNTAILEGRNKCTLFSACPALDVFLSQNTSCSMNQCAASFTSMSATYQIA